MVNIARIIVCSITIFTGSAFAQDYSDYGMHRAMTNMETSRYNQCLENIRTLQSSAVINGKQLTIPEALGSALTKRMCACTAVRLKTDSDTFPVSWQSCAQTIIGSN